ncbi:MAG: hypothetical protein EXR76_14715 [Myxococcales bacterium]|nr:hypothetical protein [Myxococcales bacterium]
MDQTCGNCRFFKVTRERDDGQLGECRLGKVLGVFRDVMRACPSFSRHGATDAPVAVEGRRRVERRRSEASAERVRVSSGQLRSAVSELTAEQLKGVMHAVLNELVGAGGSELGRFWTAGELVLMPSDDSLKPKQVPLDTLFHKLVMIRDNLRVMEQKINSHEQLQDSEKLDLQRRINVAYRATARLSVGHLDTTTGDGPEGDAHDLLVALIFEAEQDSMSAAPPLLGERWGGGEARWIREGESVVEPIEVFFTRLMLLRDRLITLELHIGAHAHIAPDEAESMGSYIRRCFGSLTSFNVLLRERENYFASSR